MGFEARNTNCLDDDSQTVIDTLNAAGAPNLGQKSPDQVRHWMRKNFDLFTLSPKPQVAKIEELTAPCSADGENSRIPVRIYRPETSGEEPLPILVYFHAGGYVFGDPDFLDDFCGIFARDVSCLVLSVDYQRAPEHKFPAAIEDCYAATSWAAAHAEEIGGDRNRLAVGGDSSGGTLAIVTAQLAVERGGPAICHQLLWYPGVGTEGQTASGSEFAEGYFLETV